jgi:hypothetical protein
MFFDSATQRRKSASAVVRMDFFLAAAEFRFTPGVYQPLDRINRTAAIDQNVGDHG